MWDQEAFWADVKKTETCWLWQGAVNNRGHAQTTSKHGGKPKAPHIVAWELSTGAPPTERVRQTCSNTLCVRPDHLRLFTDKDLLHATFWLRVTKADGDACWLWQGPFQTVSGYGIVSVKKKHSVAHRVAYELTYGTFDKALQVCHKCDNPPCVRPDHLFLGTAKDNSDDKVQKDRQAKGVRTASAKITEDDVRKIRELRASGMRLKEIAVMFGLKTEGAVHGIATGRLWKHVDAPTVESQPLGFNGPRERCPPIPPGSRWKNHKKAT